MTAKKIKEPLYLRDDEAWQWVALAAADKKNYVPLLQNIEVSDKGKTLFATDRHRLHMARLTKSVGLKDGLYNATTRAPVMLDLSSIFPNWRAVVDPILARQGWMELQEISTPSLLWAILQGGELIAKKVSTDFLFSLNGDLKGHAVNPRYVATAMLSLQKANRLTRVHIGETLADPFAVHVVDSQAARVALVMKVRAEHHVPAQFYSLAPFFKPVE